MTEPAPNTPPAEQSTPPAEQPKGNEAPKLTPEHQATVDAIIARRVADERKRMDGEVERRVQEQLERSKMDAAQRAEAERDEARREKDETKSSAALSVAEARVETALLAAGIKPEHTERVIRLININAVAGSDDQRKAAADAVRDIVTEFPELRRVSGASGGELAPAPRAGSVSLEQFKNMDVDARSELYVKDINLYRSLAKQEKEAA